jgi:4-amino-4-deoxy-L-arabinose transferase-like glycosyltransferase
LGDGQQPPLYSWLVRIFSLIFGINSYSVISLRYLCLLVFVLAIYFSAKKLFGKEKGFWLSASILAFIPSYAYTINFKLTHSVLVFAVSALSFFFYLRLIEKPNSLNYLLLGSTLGLGMLSKYNFLFFLLGLFFSNFFFKEGRALILNSRILIALTAGSLVCIPHYFWLLENDLNAFHYSATRAGFASTETNPFFNFFKLGFNAYEQLLIFTVILLLIAYPSFKSRSSIQNKIIENNAKIKALSFIAVVSFLLAVIILTILGTSRLVSGWLSTIHFVIAFMLFSFLNWEELGSKRKLLFKALSMSLILIFFLIKVLTVLSPDLFRKKPMDFLIPQEKISRLLNKEIQERGINPKKIRVLVQEAKLYANLKIRNPSLDLLLISNKSKKNFLDKDCIYLKELDRKNSIKLKYKNSSYPFSIQMIFLKTASRSSKRSSTFSMPTDNLTKLSLMPSSFLRTSGIAA